MGYIAITNIFKSFCYNTWLHLVTSTSLPQPITSYCCHGWQPKQVYCVQRKCWEALPWTLRMLRFFCCQHSGYCIIPKNLDLQFLVITCIKLSLYWFISIRWSTNTWISVISVLKEIGCFYHGQMQIEPFKFNFHSFIIANN